MTKQDKRLIWAIVAAFCLTAGMGTLAGYHEWRKERPSIAGASGVIDGIDKGSTAGYILDTSNNGPDMMMMPGIQGMHTVQWTFMDGHIGAVYDDRLSFMGWLDFVPKGKMPKIDVVRNFSKEGGRTHGPCSAHCREPEKGCEWIVGDGWNKWCDHKQGKEWPAWHTENGQGAKQQELTEEDLKRGWYHNKALHLYCTLDSNVCSNESPKSDWTGPTYGECGKDDLNGWCWKGGGSDMGLKKYEEEDKHKQVCVFNTTDGTIDCGCPDGDTVCVARVPKPGSSEWPPNDGWKGVWKLPSGSVSACPTSCLYGCVSPLHSSGPTCFNGAVGISSEGTAGTGLANLTSGTTYNRIFIHKDNCERMEGVRCEQLPYTGQVQYWVPVGVQVIEDKP